MSPDYNIPENSGRRQFLAQAATGAVAALSTRSLLADSNTTTWRSPYEAIDWRSVCQIGSGTHIHCRERLSLTHMYQRGMRHLAISNYYPSAPFRPDERQNQFRVKQSFPILAKGEYRDGPFQWNEIIQHPETGWVNDLPEELRRNIPFRMGPPVLEDIPNDVIICPNAEHHSMLDVGAHINGVGSEYASGNFDARGLYKLPTHGYPVGVNLSWRQTFKNILDQLQFDSGGGITINHPVWSNLSLQRLLEMLDFDGRVLGIEIWNHTCDQLNQKGWALDEWDQILRTGRRCFGFSVSDHAHRGTPDFKGLNILLVDAELLAAQLPEACLRAYREGQFYGTLYGDLRFAKIARAADNLHIATNLPCHFTLVTAKGPVVESVGSELIWPIPTGTAAAEHQYVRVEARQREGNRDQSFSQPIWLGN